MRRGTFSQQHQWKCSREDRMCTFDCNSVFSALKVVGDRFEPANVKGLG